MATNTDATMRASIEAETSNKVTRDTSVSGRVVESDGTLLTIIGDDGVRYMVEDASNGKDKILTARVGSRSRVKGVVTDINLGGV